MGVPTIDGSFHFHPRFKAKPTVIVGAYGIIPAERCEKGVPRVGDKIITVGGRTGRDGIHGATFSSAEMTDQTAVVNASAVQIGNAIEEKRMSDALIKCRDRDLIRAITDCGAGGFSSAIGEMGSELGVLVHLERAPLKYLGLAPWEIWVSESQERMVVAVAPKDEQLFCAICADYNVEAVTLGEFTGDGQLRVMFEEQTVCDLNMNFLHNGLPQRVLQASWDEPKLSEPDIPQPSDWEGVYERVMAHLNVCSKEPVVRLYDHGVQGTNVLPSYGGVYNDGPNDATILTPLLGKPYGLVISHGLNPVLNEIDPYWGSLWAIVEALANLAAVGGNYKKAALIDNFIWPFPDKESLGALHRSVDACVTAMQVFERPFVSGKDSLSSTHRGSDGTVIKIPPVLCVSAFGRIPDVKQTVTADFKRPESNIVLLGTLDPKTMGGSIYYDLHGHLGSKIPRVDLENLPRLLDKLHKAIREGLVLSCHDVSEGGMATTLAEMCFGGDRGARIDLRCAGEGRPDFLFFNEMAGCFLIETRATAETLRKVFNDLPWRIIGKTTPRHSSRPRLISVMWGKEELFSVDTKRLKAAWQKPMAEVFHS